MVNTRKAKSLPKVRVQIALVGVEQCIIFTDHLNMLHIYAKRFTEQEIARDKLFFWRNPENAPCPVQELDAFLNHIFSQRTRARLRKQTLRTAIYRHMTSENTVWNGIGTSHANDILHLAVIHPDERISSIFSNSQALERLRNALRKFFERALSDEYLKNVPSTSTANFAFEWSAGVTKYINETFTEVYRKESVLVSLERYQFLLSVNMLDLNKYQPLKPDTDIKAVTETGREKKKRIPVYTIRWPKAAPKVASAPASFSGFRASVPGGSFSGFSGSSSGRKASQATEESEASFSSRNTSGWIYAYTVLNRIPTQGTGYCEYLSEGEARALNAQNSIPEIGVANFYNIIQYNRQQEEGYTGRKVSVKSTGKYGKVGRPQKRRKTKKDSQVNLFQIEQRVAKKRKTPFQIEEHIRETLGTLLEEEEDANIVLVEENVEK